MTNKPAPQIERQEIRVFAAVVDASGFGRAAEQLGLSQSAVSQTVARLEHKLDAVLLLRNQKPELTEAGLRFMKFAQTVINEEANTLDDLAALRSGALSTLSLAMNSMVNRIHGHKLLLEFCDDNPLTRLQLDVAPSREIIYGVDDGRWELGFGPFLHRMPGHFTAMPFFSEQRTLVVHRDHPLAQQLQLNPEPVLGQAVLLTSFLDDAAKRPGLERLRNQFASVWEISNLELRLALARSGKGITYLSNHLLADLNDQLDGFMPVKGLDISLIVRSVGLCYKTDAPLSAGAKRFIGICQRHFPAALP